MDYTYSMEDLLQEHERMAASILKMFKADLEESNKRTEEEFHHLEAKSADNEDVIARCLERFSSMRLDQISLSGLEGYFRYLLKGRNVVGDIQFNFQLPESEISDQIILALADSRAEIVGSDQRILEIEEQQLLDNYINELTGIGSCSILVIRNCKSTPMSSEELNTWFALSDLFEKMPRTVKILRAPESVINSRFRKIDHLYYRVFRNYLRRVPASSEEIINATFSGLQEKGFAWTPEFEEELKSYISTVYPKADLREERFVKDLIDNRIIVQYYTCNTEDNRCLEESCIPFYVRPKKENEQSPKVDKKFKQAEITEKPKAIHTYENGSDQILVENGEALGGNLVFSTKKTGPFTDELPRGKEVGQYTIYYKAKGDEDHFDSAIETLYPIIDSTTTDSIEEMGLSVEKSITGPIKNLLIVSLSTFPYSLTKCTCYDQTGELITANEGEYYYQQEPFPMRLRDELHDYGEVLMLVTDETLKVTVKEKAGETIIKSPMSYFVDSVKTITASSDIVFRAVLVDQDDPIDAISKVVNHLRAIMNDELNVYLGTNGGLRSTQLILEAILSSLSADGIDVAPQNVWSMRQRSKSRTEWELFNSAAEFKIFDFVSGINEFIQYGRIGSLERFLLANPEIYDNSVEKLIVCLKLIAEGIQYGSINTFEDGLDSLAIYFRDGSASNNPYIELFRGTIRNDFDVLVNGNGETRSVLEEIKWCVKKGFFQQAINLVEAAIPREIFMKGIIAYTNDVLFEAEERKSEKEISENYIFNHSAVWIANRIEKNRDDPYFWRIRHKCKWKDEDQPDTTVFAEFQKGIPLGKQSERFIKILLLQKSIKDSRNGLVHVGEDGAKGITDYRNDLDRFILLLGNFYEWWERHSNTPPLLNLYLDR